MRKGSIGEVWRKCRGTVDITRKKCGGNLESVERKWTRPVHGWGREVLWRFLKRRLGVLKKQLTGVEREGRQD